MSYRLDQSETNKYQLYAKPNDYDCYGIMGQSTAAKNPSSFRGQNTYVPPITDIRALEQTMYIPVIPTKPGGETEVTFPMTPRTMGQPDMTTACCVPVLPCMPGFKHLTQNIKPTAQEICSQGNYCQENNLKHDPCQHSGGLQCCRGGFSEPPTNMAGDSFVGLPDTFPPVTVRQDLPQNSGGQAYARESNNNQTSYNNQQYVDKQASLSDFEDPCGTSCQGPTSFKVNEQSARKAIGRRETMQQRKVRLSTMFGAYGACMMAEPKTKRLRHFSGSIREQGNGFHWSHPENTNELCYVLDKQQEE